ncbi:MAG: amino acid--tRNA ligase-related protein, partial [Gammaproteobacteria bacterium]
MVTPSGSHDSAADWRPTAALSALRRRAALLQDVRGYFHGTAALEVDTPLLDRHGATDPALASFTVTGSAGGVRYLQTSPEFAMKRLLAAGSGDIYQVCHAFRREEGSRLHQEEFTLLEWYRVGRDHHGLMDDVTALLAAVGFPWPVRRQTYAALCRTHVGLDPHTASTADLAACAQARGAVFAPRDRADRALLLDWLFGCAVMPCLPRDAAVLVHDFPVEQAAYARV